MTGLSTRQLRWWDTRHLLRPAVPTHPTDKGGFTERRYTSIEVLELMVLADLRRRGFTISRLRALLDALKAHFNVRLFDAIDGGGPLTLFIEGHRIFARTQANELYNVLDAPTQPLLMLGENIKLRQLTARESRPSSGRMGSQAGARARSRRRGGNPV